MRLLHSNIVCKFFKNILQRRRSWNVIRHRETQALCLSRSVVGILPQDDDLRLGERRAVERVENRIHVGKYAARAVLLYEEAAQFPVVGLFHLVGEKAAPIVLENLHRASPLRALYYNKARYFCSENLGGICYTIVSVELYH